MLRAVGRELGKMHTADIIHGDLTTSNMMVRLRTGNFTGAAAPFEVVRSLSLPLESESSSTSS